MALAFFEVSEPRVKPADDAETKSSKQRSHQQVDEISPAVRQRMAAEADRMLARFDSNKDGKVGKYETP